MVDSSDKRDFMRMHVEIGARFKINGHNEYHQGTVADLSAGGLLLSTQIPLADGDELEIQVVPEKAVVPPLHAKLKVLRVDNEQSQQYRAGCKITEFLS